MLQDNFIDTKLKLPLWKRDEGNLWKGNSDYSVLRISADFAPLTKMRINDLVSIYFMETNHDKFIYRVKQIYPEYMDLVKFKNVYKEGVLI